MAVSDTWRMELTNGTYQLTSVKQITVGIGGWSAGRCENGHFLPDPYPATSPAWVTCACGAIEDDTRYAVRQQSIELMTNQSHAQHAIWFHLSTSPNLFTNTRDDLMHWGEFDTVMDHYIQRNSLLKTSALVRYLYSAVLKPSSIVSDRVFIENQNVANHAELEDEYAQHGPTRYLNARERPGSISLVARKHDFVVHEGFDLLQEDRIAIQIP